MGKSIATGKTQDTPSRIAEHEEKEGKYFGEISKAQQEHTSKKDRFCEDSEDIRAKIAILEAERVSKATQEIQEILDKYGVVLEAMAVIPASRINIVPRPSR